MPYKLEEADGGFYVVGPSGRKSNRPLTREHAVRQMRALYASEPAARHAQEGGVIPMSKSQMQGSTDAVGAMHNKRGTVSMSAQHSASMPEQMQGAHNATGSKSKKRAPMNQKQRRAAMNDASEPDADDVKHFLNGGILPVHERMPAGTGRGRPMNQKQRRAEMADEKPPVMALHNAPNVPGARNGNFFIAKAVGKNKGKFSAKAKAAGKSTAEYASEKAGAPGTLGKEARLAKTLMGMHGK